MNEVVFSVVQERIAHLVRAEQRTLYTIRPHLESMKTVLEERIKLRQFLLDELSKEIASREADEEPEIFERIRNDDPHPLTPERK